MVDTNTDPTLVDFAIPANDDASKSIALILTAVTQSIAEGLNERRLARDKQAEEAEEEEIRVKSETLEIAEELDDKEAAKSKTGEPKVLKHRDDKKGIDKPKRARKPISKKS